MSLLISSYTNGGGLVDLYVDKDMDGNNSKKIIGSIQRPLTRHFTVLYFTVF